MLRKCNRSACLLVKSAILIAGIHACMAAPVPVMAADDVDISNEYEWKPIKIGGGGFTMGIVIHPTSGDRYIRNDVNGAYRWDPAAGQWRLLI